MRPVIFSHLSARWKWFIFVFYPGLLEFRINGGEKGVISQEIQRKELGLRMIIVRCLSLTLLWVLSSDLYFLSFTSLTRLSIRVFTTRVSLLGYFCITVSQWEEYEMTQGRGRPTIRLLLSFHFLKPIWTKTQREKEEEELPKADNREKEGKRWEQGPKASWGENEKKLEICHFHCYHVLLYFKSESFYEGSGGTFI